MWQFPQSPYVIVPECALPPRCVLYESIIQRFICYWTARGTPSAPDRNVHEQRWEVCEAELTRRVEHIISSLMAGKRFVHTTIGPCYMCIGYSSQYLDLIPILGVKCLASAHWPVQRSIPRKPPRGLAPRQTSTMQQETFGRPRYNSISLYRSSHTTRGPIDVRLYPIVPRDSSAPSRAMLGSLPGEAVDIHEHASV